MLFPQIMSATNAMATVSLGRRYEKPNTAVFSQFIYKDNCTGKILISYIEPLAASLRHPWAFCARGPRSLLNPRKDAPDLFYKSYMMLPYPFEVGKKQVLIFDAGSKQHHCES